MIHITHIITGLYVGGAENMLSKLLTQFSNKDIKCSVISLLPLGPLAFQIKSLNIPVYSLNMNRSHIQSFSSLFMLGRLLNHLKPDIIQTWMYHADLIGGIAAKLFLKNTPVVWNIRHNVIEKGVDKKSTHFVSKICGLLSSYLPELIICCSNSSIINHQKYGYNISKLMIIPNGFNIDKFKFDESIRTSIRNSMGITEKEIVIGMVARFHPHKDHRNFINACSILIKHLPILRIILIGDNVSPKNVELNNLLLENRLHDKTFLLGRRDDVANYLSAFDIGVLSSSGEAFPNVLGEMMACELPCVTTDVGDTKEIIGDCGLVVPSKDPLKLANAILQLALKSSISRRELGKKSRQRIFKFYNIETISNKYLSLYYNVLEKYKTRLK
mgnify:CR=1 FL=1|jgi:glycosyltransferase involved in cell wall biosynthesis